jgi:hypothetical protein
MQDIAYVIGTVAFFSVMGWFVRACERLIASDERATEEAPQ